MWGSVDILKALDFTTTSGQALVPQIVDPYIAELALKVAPLRQLIPKTPWTSGTYDRNKRISFGKARFVGDAITVPESQSTIVRFQEPLKIIMSKGGVTGFLQEASQELVDALQLEIKGHTIETFHEEEFGMLYGNRYADSYQFNGLDTWIKTGVIDAGGDNISFKILDAGIDRILDIGGKPSCIIMSHTMLSAVSRLLINQQRFLDKVEIEGGVRLLTYRDIPIYPTSFLKHSNWIGGTVTATAVSGGNLTAGTTYYYKISAILQTGETLASGEVYAETTSTNKSIKLTWSTPSNPDIVRLYKIFRSTSTGTETLLTVIPAFAYNKKDDLIGTLETYPVTSFTDTGVYNNMTVNIVSNHGEVIGANYIPEKVEYPITNADDEDIYIVSTEVPNVEGYACHRAVLKDIGYMPLARIADKEWFLIVGYETFICVEQFCSKLHRVRVV
ncbi:MAG: hypothetical protein QXN68_00740 [Thermoplasmata archaeon]